MTEPDLSRSSPYDEKEEPELDAAWREGYRAGIKQEPVPEGINQHPDKESCAWIDGYTAAQL